MLAVWGYKDFELVQDAAGVRFVAASGVGDALKERLLSTTYPTAAAAELAATGDEVDSGEIVVQHAVGICTHFDDVVSFGDGSRRHVTDFTGHQDGRHYTVTKHQHRTLFGWRTDARFRYSASRRFCGCN